MTTEPPPHDNGKPEPVEPSRDKPRVYWVDLAKLTSIMLVVLWHALTTRIEINVALAFLRMPLFFFAAGLFAGGAMKLSWREFFVRKVGNIFYLYLLWVLMLYLTIEIPRGQVQGDTQWHYPLRAFYDPPTTLWFMAALGIAFILVRALRSVPAWIVLPALLAGYVFSLESAGWDEPPFPHRVLRLTPFLYMGLLSFSLMQKRLSRFSLLFPIPVALYLVLAFANIRTVDEPSWWMTLPLSLLGIAGLCMTCQFLERFDVAKFFAGFGKYSLHIYVMHRIPLTAGLLVLSKIGLLENVPIRIALAGACFVGCIAVGAAIERTRLAWLFKAPWLRRAKRDS